MFTLIRDGKKLNNYTTFERACEAASEKSLEDCGCVRVWADGTSTKGCIVSVWSGPIGPYVKGSKAVRGITKHVVYSCGKIF